MTSDKGESCVKDGSPLFVLQIVVCQIDTNHRKYATKSNYILPFEPIVFK